MAKPPYKPPKFGPQAEFKPDAFRAAIHFHGSMVRWEQSSKCPCMEFNTDESGNPRPTGLPRVGCAECHGKGFLFHDPQELKALVLGGARIPLFLSLYGERARGMANITTFAEIVPREWDRFTVLNTVIRMSEDRVREGAVADRLRYPITSKVLELGKSETRPTVLVEEESNGIYMRRATSAGIIAGTPCLEGVNFSIVNGQVVWIAHANTPAIGERFSITYFANPAYIVQDSPHVHRDVNIAFKQGATTKRQHMPLQLHCWLEHIGPPHGYETA